MEELVAWLYNGLLLPCLYQNGVSTRMKDKPYTVTDASLEDWLAARQSSREASLEHIITEKGLLIILYLPHNESGERAKSTHLFYYHFLVSVIQNLS